MYLKLSEKELEIIKKISKITMTDYELEGDMLPEDSITVMLEDLLIEYNYIKEKYDDLEKQSYFE